MAIAVDALRLCARSGCGARTLSNGSFMSDTNRTTWDFLANSYWYVPPPDLPALQFSSDNNLLTWVGDQTVWHLSGYQSGYFWGACAVASFSEGQANANPPPAIQQSRIVGSVTADGRVLMNFISGSGRQESIVTGYGTMVQVAGQWAFQMQMATGAGGTRLLHWANMLQTKEGDRTFAKLPGVNYSVEEMLAGASYPAFADPTAS